MAYPNLVAEMTRRSITAKDIAGEIGRSPDTVNNWLKGKETSRSGKPSRYKRFFPDVHARVFIQQRTDHAGL